MGGHLLGSLHGVGEGQRVTPWRGRRSVEPPAQVREGGRQRGRCLVGHLGLLGYLGPKGRMAIGLFGPKAEGKSFLNKNWILNTLGLWKFIQGNLGGIFIWGFLLDSSRLLKDFRKILYAMPCNAILMERT
jgi:hypothetical protein